MNYKAWRQQRALDAQVKKAIRHAGRLSSIEALELTEQSIYAIGEALSRYRTVTDPDYRFQIIAEAKASADVASIMLESILTRQGLLSKM